MNRKQLEERLQLLGAAIAQGPGASDAYAGAKLWESLIEGSGGGAGSGQGWNWLYTSARHAPAIAATLRAVLERLDPVEQATVWAMYCAGLHTRQLQAGSLKIKVPALKARRRKIFIKLLDWFGGGKALRREASAGLEEARLSTLAADHAKEVARIKTASKTAIEAARLAGNPVFGKRPGTHRASKKTVK